MSATIDVIIPCYNAANTLERAVFSVLNQPQLGTLWLIDDCSTDHTFALACQLAERFPEKIQIEQMPRNGGAAKARNWGALQSQAELIAFLDADDAYEQGALEVATMAFHFRPELSVLRLNLTPINLAERYATHPDFAKAWRYMQMTCGGNVCFRRNFFLACGGFPQDSLFRELGGEDGCLGIATTQVSVVGTAFDERGVLHYCREGMHAERLLNMHLFGQTYPEISPEKYALAESISDKICQQIVDLKTRLNSAEPVILPLIFQRS